MMGGGWGMSGPPRHAKDLFRPLRPATGLRFIAAVIIGPFLWLVAFLTVAWLVDETDIVEAFLLLTFGSFVVAFLVLLLLHARRNRERRRYEGG